MPMFFQFQSLKTFHPIKVMTIQLTWIQKQNSIMEHFMEYQEISFWYQKNTLKIIYLKNLFEQAHLLQSQLFYLQVNLIFSLNIFVDYQRLNGITIKDCYPISFIQEILNQLSQAYWCSKLEVIAVFHKIRIKEGEK